MSSSRLILFSLLFAVACATTSMSQTSPGKSGGVGSGQAVKGVAPLKIESKPEPDWPESVTGSCIIVLRAIFTKDGKVTDIKFIEAREYNPKSVSKKDIRTMTKRSIEAARKIKFLPAWKDGRPVSMLMQLEYDFSPDALKEKPDPDK